MRSTPLAAFLHDLELLLAAAAPRVERVRGRARRGVTAATLLALALLRF